MNVALIGISGWGGELLRALRRMDGAGELRLAAVAELQLERNRDTVVALEASGTHCRQDYRRMLAEEKGLDAVVIATPIHLHRAMAVEAMEAGLHVLLEKPPAVTVQDVDAIIGASERTGRHCAVDFLNASSPSFLRLRKAIAGGALGNIRCITGVGLWERLDSYYARTDWAGKLVHNGNYVLDGTVNNPLSHLLNNMLLLGLAAPNGGVPVDTVTAELYHAHDIPGEDNACVRIRSGGGIEYGFYATLCHDGSETPWLTVEGERGTAYWDYAQRMELKPDGTAVERADPVDDGDNNDEMLSGMVRNLLAVASGAETALYCSVPDTRAFILASNGAFESSGGVHGIPAWACARKPKDGSVSTHLLGVKDLIVRAAAGRRLYSELGVDWAVPGKPMDMAGYKRFEMKFQSVL